MWIQLSNITCFKMSFHFMPTRHTHTRISSFWISTSYVLSISHKSTTQPPRDLKQILYRFQLCNDVDGAMPHIFVAFPLLKQTYLAGWDNLILKWKSICYRGIKSMNMISINTIIRFVFLTLNYNKIKCFSHLQSYEL